MQNARKISLLVNCHHFPYICPFLGLGKWKSQSWEWEQTLNFGAFRLTSIFNSTCWSGQTLLSAGYLWWMQWKQKITLRMVNKWKAYECSVAQAHFQHSELVMWATSSHGQMQLSIYSSPNFLTLFWNLLSASNPSCLKASSPILKITFELLAD